MLGPLTTVKMKQTPAVLFALSLAIGRINAFVGPSAQLLQRGRSGTLCQDQSNQASLWSRLQAHEFALLFDCDGVILETEELHRVAYNAAFREFDLTIDGKPVEWSVRFIVRLSSPVCSRARCFFAQLNYHC